MIFLQDISLTQFRNYFSQRLSFKEKIVGICGANGCGKTNLLDAIHFLCFTRSYFSKSDAQSVYPNTAGFRIEGNILKKNSHNLICILRENNKKEFQLDKENYKKFSEHIGKFPCVFIAPDDVQLITEGSEPRRQFLDALLSQLNHGYLQHLIDYKKILEERNSLLKSAFERNYFDEQLLNILDDQLIKNGEQIFTARKTFLDIFLPQVQKEYFTISGSYDDIVLNYSSQLSNVSFKELLKENLQRDLYMQRTGCGIHKDDIEIKMQQLTFKNIASQGQRKSLLFALKLAEFNILKEKKGFAPLLLLDDIFEKLDVQRMHKLLQKVCNEDQTQIFITDTHKERLQKAFKNLQVNYQLIELTPA
jgi:DNA replication and repair protein RecF